MLSLKTFMINSFSQIEIYWSLALEKKEEATDFELGLEAGGKINKKKEATF